ncbi:hypothetical protein BpHYR1_035709 [Brachionus plicatilis]|uniref:Uncharacterized protein n=1 Tax=Brachionus plicatilis TaxID=10195 RepID=A0A3M7QW10_BRAPC|nr:hypothetical protein BpHYR1_035709 [Brachionus plicatilis]
MKFLNESLTIELQRNIEIVRVGFIDTTNLKDKDKDIKFRSINSLVEYSIYDTSKNEFLLSSQFIPIINSNSQGSNARELAIKEAISSCPIVLQDSLVGRKSAVGLVSFFLGILLLIIPILIVCFLCLVFKKLKCRDSRVILKEQIIPIEIEPEYYPSTVSNGLYLKPANWENLDQIFDDSNQPSYF